MKAGFPDINICEYHSLTVPNLLNTLVAKS